MKLLLFFASLALAAQSNNAILTWSDLVNPPSTQYNVYRAPTACTAPTPVFVKLNPTPITPKTYTDPALAVGTYCYRITATDGTQESAPSATASAAVYAAPAPAAPGGPSISVVVVVQP